MTNSEESKTIELDPHQICGISGWLEYTEYGEEFSGRFDNHGRPLLTRGETRRHAPIVTPFPGLFFAGQQVSHEPSPFFVLDSCFLTLAFATPFIGARPRALGHLVRAVETTDPNEPLAWEILEHDNHENIESLTPQVNARKREPFICPRDLTFPLHEAVKHLTLEIELLRNERFVINPEMTEELPSSEAYTQAHFKVLGKEFRQAFEQHFKEQRLPWRPGISTGAECIRMKDYRTMLDPRSETREFLLSRLNLVARHPILTDLVEKSVDRVTIQNRGLARREGQLEQLLERCRRDQKQSEPLGQNLEIPKKMLQKPDSALCPNSTPQTPLHIKARSGPRIRF